MARIRLPHKALGTFIHAAHSWLGQTLDAKTGLEVCFANQNGKLHVSVGADTNYIEAVLKVDPADIEALKEPIFLDVPSLAAYDFKTDGLTMVVPISEAEMKIDQRITFSVPGFNLRIPRKKGDIWKRNYFKLGDLPVEGLRLDEQAFAKLSDQMFLPNSFKVDKQSFQICFDVKEDSFCVHCYDGFGALCHTFKGMHKGTVGRMVFLEDFFKPCKTFKVDNEIVFGITDSQCLGEFKSDSTGIEVLRWTQPRFQKLPSEIPGAIEKKRTENAAILLVQPGEMVQKIEKVCILLTPAEIKGTAVEMDVVNSQYELITRKPSGEGEVRAGGELLAPAQKNLNVALQAGCWKDYLSQFERRASVTMEILKDTVLLSQSIEGMDLIYWMPLPPRSGSR